MKNHPDLPENAPQWLRDADIKYPKVEIINGLVIWHNGLWHNGLWHNGVWYGGEWRGGKWCGGKWCGGIWCGGEELAPRAHWSFMQINGNLKIGCKEKTIPDWKEWFKNSNERFAHSRNSEEFDLIKTAFYKFYAS